MRKILAITFVSSLMMTSCSQPETSARYYQYGGVQNAGSSLGLHTMRKGETLWTVSKAYNVDLRDMLDMNKLSAPYKMRVGERIKIPAPTNYTVKGSDTLYKVSRMFDTTTTELARLNNIKSPYKLSAGQNLRLPPRHAQPKIVAPQLDIVSSSPKLYHRTDTVEREELKPLKSSPAISQGRVDSSAVTRLNEPVQIGNVHFIKPVAGQVISGYGPKEDGLHNDGINIKAAQGDAVRAAENGVVVYQGNQIEGYGNMVLIRHANGYLTAYAHMAKTLVRKGDKVKRGQTIGTVGASGNVKTPQLHFEIRKGRNAIDPATFIKI